MEIMDFTMQKELSNPIRLQWNESHCASVQVGQVKALKSGPAKLICSVISSSKEESLFLIDNLKILIFFSFPCAPYLSATDVLKIPCEEVQSGFWLTR